MNALKAIRESSGLTQAQIAQKAGIATMTYVRYENPKYRRTPPVETAIKIAKALNTSVENLWDYNNPR